VGGFHGRLPHFHYLEVLRKVTEIFRITGMGFEAFTAVVIKRSIFWDITPCIGLN
jgi:hypothetical protein